MYLVVENLNLIGIKQEDKLSVPTYRSFFTIQSAVKYFKSGCLKELIGEIFETFPDQEPRRLTREEIASIASYLGEK